MLESVRWFFAILAVIGASHFAAEAQELSETLQDWVTVPADQSGLVLFVNADLEGSTVYAEAVGGVKESTFWGVSLPFLKQYRIVPGSYRVGLPGPIEWITLSAQPGKLTFLRIERYQPEEGEPGIQIASWTGVPSSEILGTFYALSEIGFQKELAPTALEPTEKTLYFDTDPPWELPPPPR